MREIKFRGKSTMDIEEMNNMGFTHNNGWVEGNLISGEGPFIVGPVVEADQEYLAHEWWVPVHLESVVQYTGLKDKNGKEIYEGDVLQEQTTHPLEVFIEDGHVNVRYVDMGEVEEEWLFQSEIYQEDLEIIGNIYEHPHLLKG